MNMKLLKKLHLLQFLLLFNLILGSSIHHHNHTKYYGNITTQPPFLTSNSSIPSLVRISVNIPNHVPEICKGCEKPNGSCGAGLNCLCHPKECKDKVISKVRSIKSTGNVFFSLLSLIGTIAFLMDA
ncbi:uncharacterized protein LOC123924703 [Trifolium pratense]|uniref:uncharacterized protein LOC123924703 n=1 Tax=Trifolium pratense TaxID=57577 RepID=UPI001E691673|nr:uncharacterized protein LOC123924703 [Trifolium pratense]